MADLARQHNRSLDAVEHQLVKQGVWNRLERRPMSEDQGCPDTSSGDAAAPPWGVNEGSEDPSGGLRQGA